MKITICGSIQFSEKMKEAADELIKMGHQVELPLTTKRILNGELTLEEFSQEKEKAERKIKDDVIRKYYDIIKNSEAILVVNMEKKNIPGYIGGNTLLEMGFAYVLNKRIYLLNEIPEMAYTDEIVAMQPVVISGNLSLI